MKVAVLCEWSGAVRDAFIDRGHEAYSVDHEPSAAGGPHIQADIRDLDYSDRDLLIAFPPCTNLSVSGARYFSQKLFEQVRDIELVKWILRLPVRHIALENPVGVISRYVRPPDQIIQPWQFGHDASKKTCLWLKNLPLLEPTAVIKKARYANQKSNPIRPKQTQPERRSGENPRQDVSGDCERYGGPVGPHMRIAHRIHTAAGPGVTYSETYRRRLAGEYSERGCKWIFRTWLAAPKRLRLPWARFWTAGVFIPRSGIAMSCRAVRYVALR